jgi:hypothetical protein
VTLKQKWLDSMEDKPSAKFLTAIVILCVTAVVMRFWSEGGVRSASGFIFTGGVALWVQAAGGFALLYATFRVARRGEEREVFARKAADLRIEQQKWDDLTRERRSALLLMDLLRSEMMISTPIFVDNENHKKMKFPYGLDGDLRVTMQFAARFDVWSVADSFLARHFLYGIQQAQNLLEMFQRHESLIEDNFPISDVMWKLRTDAMKEYVTRMVNWSYRAHARAYQLERLYPRSM